MAGFLINHHEKQVTICYYLVWWMLKVIATLFRVYQLNVSLGFRLLE
jgi:hypothetical protein